MQKRVFFMAHQKCYGATGGGHGVVYRLYESNKIYHYFDDVYFVFKDRVIHNTDDCGTLAENIFQKKENTNSFKAVLKKCTPKIIRVLKQIIENQIELEKNKKRIKTLDSKLHFSADDIYFFNDYFCAYSFFELFDYPHCVVVFHMQGSIYNEWEFMSGLKSNYLKRKFDVIFRTIAQKARIFAFPAKGAEESVIASDYSLNGVIGACERAYLYNGVSCPDIVDYELEEWISKIKSNCDEIKFITVANLNAAKAVERIPAYLKRIKDVNISFKWILIGNGVKAEEVRKQIKQNEISENTIWIDKYVNHNEIMQLFSITDFYILFQRFSIFDLSTLEAMHYGNIPVLTPVGGNKEVIIRDNGFFVDNFTDANELIRFIMSGNLNEKKKVNREIQATMFNDEAMIKRYYDLSKYIDEN